MTSADERECPVCAETIKARAKKCKYCGEWLKQKEPGRPSDAVEEVGDVDVNVATLECHRCAHVNKFRSGLSKYCCAGCDANLAIAAKRLLSKATKSAYVDGSIESKRSGATGSAQVANYFKLAQAAEDAENHSEAYKYYTLILETNPDHHRAWFGKAFAAAWQSTLAKLRLAELTQQLDNALELAPDSQVAKLKEQAATRLRKVATGLLALALEIFNMHVTPQSHSEFITHVDRAISLNELSFTHNPKDREALDNVVEAIHLKMSVYNVGNQNLFLDDDSYQEAKKELLEIQDEIRKFEPGYQVVIPKPGREQLYANNGCTFAGLGCMVIWIIILFSITPR